MRAIAENLQSYEQVVDVSHCTLVLEVVDYVLMLMHFPNSFWRLSLLPEVDFSR
jgi:hypothetical protein